MDLSNSIVLPREDFFDLQKEALNQLPVTNKERVKTIGQTIVVSSIITGAVIGGRWAWLKLTEKYAEKALQRRIREPQFFHTKDFPE